MLLCPRCQRPHPDEAAFCYFDGTPLRDSGAGGRPGALPFDFVFPSGRRCRTFDELTAGCQEEWETARELLRQGAIAQFLTGMGRLDLAKAASEAAGQADADIGLATFLEGLPGSKPPRAELDLEPHKLLVGNVPTGEKQIISLRVINGGSGLLHGTIQVADDGAWLRLAGGQTIGRLKVRHEETVELEVDTHGLVPPRKCAGRLTLITNGGVVEVPVRLEVTARPFAHAPFAGAASPRDLAARMKDNPKAAAPQLESGEVARWFEANGWAYPITGRPARGVGAVQQFFEGLGLAKVPVVRLAETEVKLTAKEPGTLQGQAVLTTADRKWIYAEAESETPWLRVTTSQASGPQQATVDFEVDPRSLASGQTHVGKLRIRANGNQVLTLPILVEVPRPKRSAVASVAGPLLVGAVGGSILRLWLISPTDPGFAPNTPVHFQLCIGAGGVCGALAGTAALAWRRGRWADLACGAIAGGWAGAALGGTLACLAPLVETAGLAAAAVLWAAAGVVLAVFWIITRRIQVPPA